MYKEQIEETTANPLNLRKLLAGRLDGSILNPPHVTHFLRAKNAVGKIERRSIVLQHKMHMIFSKKSVTARVVKSFDQAIKALRADGALDKIVGKYID